MLRLDGKRRLPRERCRLDWMSVRRVRWMHARLARAAQFLEKRTKFQGQLPAVWAAVDLPTMFHRNFEPGRRLPQKLRSPGGGPSSENNECHPG